MEGKNSLIKCKGHEECVVRAQEMLEKMNLPGGLLPLEDMEEIEFHEETGYFNVKQKQKMEHKFNKINKLVSYGAEVKGYLVKNRIKSLSGVRAKELFFWAPIGDISVDAPDSGKIHFKSFAGVGKAFPVEAFAPGE